MTQFYSYLWLREDGTPYYAGKGYGNRAFTSRGHRVRCPKDQTRILVFPMLNEAEAFESEIALIELFGRKDLGTGCLRNRTDGGEGRANALVSAETRRKQRAAKIGKPSARKNWHPSDETRKRQSDAAKKRAEREKQLGLPHPHGTKSHPQSAYTKQKLREANVGRPLTVEHRQKLSEAKIGNQSHLGFRVSDEAKQRMSLLKKGKPWTAAQRAAYEKRKCQIITV